MTNKQREAFEMVLKYDNQENIDVVLNEFKKSDEPLEDFIKEVYPTSVHNTGGGCLVTVAFLDNKTVAVVSDEYIGVYKGVDAFYNDEGNNCLMGAWL